MPKELENNLCISNDCQQSFKEPEVYIYGQVSVLHTRQVNNSVDDTLHAGQVNIVDGTLHAGQVNSVEDTLHAGQVNC